MTTSTAPAGGEPRAADPADQPAAPAPRKRAPRKPTKPDAVLAAAVETARQGLLEITGEEEIGAHVGVTIEADRLLTHRFEANRRGYAGWQWYATLARVPRGKVATVCEVGLLPSGKALLAPEWVPWSERVRPEDIAADKEQAEAEEAAADAGDSAADAEGGTGSADAGTDSAEGEANSAEGGTDSADAGPAAEAGTTTRRAQAPAGPDAQGGEQEDE